MDQRDRPMLDSGDESPGGSRSRSRSRSPRQRLNDDANDSSSDLENLSPQSMKWLKLMDKALTVKLAPVMRKLNQNGEISSQIKGVVDVTKKTVIDVRHSNSHIEDRLKKASKGDPKSNLSSLAITKLYNSVFRNLKTGDKKEKIQTSVFDELIDRALVTPADESAVKAVVAQEIPHLKAHLRTLISQDLASGNSVELPKTFKYLKSHFKTDTIEEDTIQFCTIMALGAAKFENLQPVQLGERDKENKQRIDEHIDNFWSWVQMKFKKYMEKGETFHEKLQHIMNHCGYKAKKNEGAIRRTT